MENKLVNQQEQDELQLRSLSIVADEIIILKRQAQGMLLMYAVEVGKRLVEAKALLQHGDWGKWLKENVDYSKSTANNLMNLYEEYGKNPNFQTFGILACSKAVKLLAIPTEEREEFINENPVDEMSVRELEKAIKERNEALKERDEAIKKSEQAEKDIQGIEELREALKNAEYKMHEATAKANTIAGKALELEKKLEKAKAENQKLKDNPVVSDEVLNGIKAEIEEKNKQELEQRIEENSKALKLANEAKEKAEMDVLSLKNELEKLQKQTKMSNPDVMEFKALFDRIQKDAATLLNIHTKIKDSDKELSEKLASALKVFLEQNLKAIKK